MVRDAPPKPTSEPVLYTSINITSSTLVPLPLGGSPDRVNFLFIAHKKNSEDWINLFENSFPQDFGAMCSILSSLILSVVTRCSLHPIGSFNRIDFATNPYNLLPNSDFLLTLDPGNCHSRYC
jgi:hypothetical protein